MSPFRMTDRLFKKAVLKGLAPLREGQVRFEDSDIPAELG